MVRFPGAWRTLSALGQRVLSPHSRLRRALLRRNVVSGWAAASRRDFELMLVRYAPDVEVEFDPGRGGLAVREQSFFGWDKGLRAAELDPDAEITPRR